MTSDLEKKINRHSEIINAVPSPIMQAVLQNTFDAVLEQMCEDMSKLTKVDILA